MTPDKPKIIEPLADLKTKLKKLVNSIRRLNDRLEDGQIPIQEEELTCRLENLNAAIKEANQLQEKIEDLDVGDEFGEELEELSRVTKAKILSLIWALKTASETKILYCLVFRKNRNSQRRL